MLIQRGMQYAVALLFDLSGLVLLFVGWFLLIRAAFRQSAWWGIGCLLLAPVKLVFLVRHWADARTAFFRITTGVVLISVGVCALAPGPGASQWLRRKIAERRYAKAISAETALNTQIQQQRDRIEQLEATFAKAGTALVQQFSNLSARRKNLDNGDVATVNSFNAEAADYQARNTARQQAAQEILSQHAELARLLALRSQRTAAVAAESDP